MKKHAAVTIIVGFIFGIILGGFLGDIIDFGSRQVRRFQAARALRQGDVLVSQGRDLEAVKVYEAVREREGKQMDPKRSAQLKYKEGIAYFDLAASSNTLAYAAPALQAFEEALTVYSPSRYPVQYAETQNNIGNVYSILSRVRDRRGNAERAAAAYNEALKIYTEKDYPAERRAVMENLRRTVH